MKKTILVLMFGAVLNASAVSFQWNTSAQVSFGDSLVSALTPANYTAQLVYLGTDKTWTDVTISDAGLNIQKETTVGSPVTSVSGKSGIFASRNSTASGSTKNGVAGGVYGVFLTYTDSAGVNWYNISATTFTIPADADESTTGLSQAFAFSSTKTELASGSSVSSGTGWVSAAVPEPSTAMLALAGLALLIKRRRA